MPSLYFLFSTVYGLWKAEDNLEEKKKGTKVFEKETEKYKWTEEESKMEPLSKLTHPQFLL